MKTTTINHRTYNAAPSKGKHTCQKVSVADKLRRYWQENRKIILCGIASLNPNVDFYSIYEMLNA